MSTHKQTEKHNEFQELVASIRATEEEAERIRADYDSKIAELLKAGREKSIEMREYFDKKAAEVKNNILSSERQKTEKMVEEIIEDARNKANMLSSKKLDKKSLEAIFNSFISSL